MTAPPPIYVIHRAQDHDRLSAITPAYDQLGWSFETIDVVDGHKTGELAKHRNNIADQFWNEDQAKPGALGCFLSHARAWRRVIDQTEEFAIIAEDDANPIPNPQLDQYHQQMEKCDLLFVNDRAAQWTDKRFESVQMVISENPQNTQKTRAPGADAYMLTRDGAGQLIKALETYGTICGVDWFMIAMGCRLKSPTTIPEIAKIHHSIGNQPRQIKAKIAREPLYHLIRDMPSAISHKTLTPISQIKQG